MGNPLNAKVTLCSTCKKTKVLKNNCNKACKTPYQNFIQPQLIIKSAREASSVTVQQPAERVLV